MSVISNACLHEYVLAMAVSTTCILQTTTLISPNNWAVKMNAHTLLYRVITSLWTMRVSRRNLEYMFAILYYAVFEIATHCQAHAIHVYICLVLPVGSSNWGILLDSIHALSCHFIFQTY
jgi:hypothetical protein